MRCDVFGGNRRFALGADKHHFIAYFDVIVTAIDHQLIHGDNSNNRSLLATNEYLATNKTKTTRNTIGVANGNSGNSGIRRKTMAEAIRNALACSHPFHKRNFGSQRKRRSKIWRSHQSRCRRNAVHGDSDTHEVVAATRVGNCGRRIRRVADRREDSGISQFCENRFVPVKLLCGKWVIGFVCNGAVGEDAFKEQFWTLHHVARKREGIGWRNTDAIHPGIDL
ncbi:unannotated protein [freshwater metagenome]|uniref:Unannotated protein n=1 Tax=freshwater metagenome TaxID=449393 RepID=A0A6J6AR47_9ZZZZ